MLPDIIFKKLIVYKAFMLSLVIIWGDSGQISNADNPDSNNLTDLGGFIFFIFSVIYLFVCYQLYLFKSLAKRLFVPLALLFIVSGFLSEMVNSMTANKNLFCLFIFYVVSPLYSCCSVSCSRDAIFL